MSSGPVAVSRLTKALNATQTVLRKALAKLEEDYETRGLCSLTMEQHGRATTTAPEASSAQERRLLSTREDIFLHYTKEEFEQAFTQYFTIHVAEAIAELERTLYLMERLS